MKVYMAYLITSEREFHNMNRNVIGDISRFTKLNDGRYIGLYAFTHDKTAFSIFSKDRGIGKNKYFVKRVVKMSKECYEEFRSLNSKFELGLYDLQCGKDSHTSMLLTNDENYNVNHSSEEVSYELLMDVVTVDYSIFTEDIVDALETIFYCYYWDIMFGDEADADDRSWNSSFLGSPDELWKNKLGFFTLLYRDLIAISDFMESAMKYMKAGDVDE